MESSKMGINVCPEWIEMNTYNSANKVSTHFIFHLMKRKTKEISIERKRRVSERKTKRNELKNFEWKILIELKMEWEWCFYFFVRYKSMREFIFVFIHIMNFIDQLVSQYFFFPGFMGMIDELKSHFKK